jgi:peptide/nickel transport system permease protein
MTSSLKADVAAVRWWRKRQQRQTGRRLSTGGRIALVLLILFLLLGIFGPILFPFDSIGTPLQDRLKPPGSILSDGSMAFFGTDSTGRDLLRQVIAGSRVSLTVAMVTVLAAGFVGLLLGVLTGYFGGWVDGIISRVGDIQLAFPSILLAILLAGVLGPSLLNVIIALAVTRWVIFARIVRASALAVRNLDFVDSARVLGVGNVRILIKYIIPSCWQPLLVAATVQVGLTMVAEASLSYLGLGVPLAQASWGATIANGRDYLGSAWWIATFPGLALAAVVVCVGIVGDAYRDKTDHLQNG